MKVLLFLMVCFIGFTAGLCGILMIYNPDGSVLGLSKSLLTETPFKDFKIPGIILAVAVGVLNLLAASFIIRDSVKQYDWAMAGGMVLWGWLTVQMILISSAHWLHFLYLGIGLMIVLMAYQIKGKWAL